MFDKFLRMANEAIDNSDLGFSNVGWAKQLKPGHKCISLCMACPPKNKKKQTGGHAIHKII